MIGKLKILSLSKEIKGLKEKKVYQDVNIHFRDLNSHTMTLKNKKEYILNIVETSIEAESLLIEGDVWKHSNVVQATNKEEELKAGTMFEFRLYPTSK
jgi:hypothetical protein